MGWKASFCFHLPGEPGLRESSLAHSCHVLISGAPDEEPRPEIEDQWTKPPYLTADWNQPCQAQWVTQGFPTCTCTCPVDIVWAPTMCQAWSWGWRQRVNKLLSSQNLPLWGEGQIQSPAPVMSSPGLCASLTLTVASCLGGKGGGQSSRLGQRLFNIV